MRFVPRIDPETGMILPAGTAAQSAPTTYYPPPQSPQMPAEVAAQIRESATSQWPGNYEMQAFEIKKQSEAWWQLHPNGQ
jgi:hypothetical protein